MDGHGVIGCTFGRRLNPVAGSTDSNAAQSGEAPVACVCWDCSDCHERVGSDVYAHLVLDGLSACCMAVGSIYGQKTPAPYGTGVQLYLWEISP